MKKCVKIILKNKQKLRILINKINEYKQEIERLKEKNDELLTLYTTERNVKEDYKAEINKAIEYIKTHTYDDSVDGDGTELMFEKANGYDLLNILQGVDKE